MVADRLGTHTHKDSKAQKTVNALAVEVDWQEVSKELPGKVVDVGAVSVDPAA